MLIKFKRFFGLWDGVKYLAEWSRGVAQAKLNIWCCRVLYNTHLTWDKRCQIAWGVTDNSNITDALKESKDNQNAESLLNQHNIHLSLSDYNKTLKNILYLNLSSELFFSLYSPQVKVLESNFSADIFRGSIV